MGRTQKLFLRKSKSGRSFQDIEKLRLPVGEEEGGGEGCLRFRRKMINCTRNRGENAFILPKRYPSLPSPTFSHFLFPSVLFFSFSSSFFSPLSPAIFLFNIFLEILFKNWPAIIHSPFYQRRIIFLDNPGG